MKTFLLLIASLFFLNAAYATDLRGRVDGMHGYAPAPFPMSGVQVTIYIAQQTPNGINYLPQVTTVSGGDGMYYLRGVPPGSYILQVGGTNYPLQVFPQPAQDIQAVLLRF